jgi:hypothetical protein
MASAPPRRRFRLSAFGVPRSDAQMSIPAIRVLLVLAMVVVVVSVDVLFFRSGSWFWERLATNVGVVLLFGAFYFRFVATS